MWLHVPGGCLGVCSPQMSGDSFTVLELKVVLDPDSSGNCAIIYLILEAAVQNNSQEKTRSKNKGRSVRNYSASKLIHSCCGFHFIAMFLTTNENGCGST